MTDILRSLDGRYLDTFGRGQYQGVTRDHYVEVDLGNERSSQRAAVADCAGLAASIGFIDQRGDESGQP